MPALRGLEKLKVLMAPCMHLQRRGNQSTFQFNLYVSFTCFANATGDVT